MLDVRCPLSHLTPPVRELCSDFACPCSCLLCSYVVISPSLAALSERLGLKRVVPLAVERGVQEILAPVVERSVTIACYTAVELVVKVGRVWVSMSVRVSARHLSQLHSFFSFPKLKRERHSWVL